MDLLELATSLSEIPHIEKHERVANLEAANNGIGCALVKTTDKSLGFLPMGTLDAPSRITKPRICTGQGRDDAKSYFHAIFHSTAKRFRNHGYQKN